VAATVGFESAILRTQDTEPTTAPPRSKMLWAYTEYGLRLKLLIYPFI